MPVDCDLCCSAPAAVHCDDCDMNLCHEQGCDENMHGDASTKDHVRTDVMGEAGGGGGGGGDEGSEMCSLCGAQSSVYCDECACFYCEENGCDADMHKPSSFATHRRRPAAEKSALAAADSGQSQNVLKTPVSVPMCELCNALAAGMYCQECDMKLCDNCNSEMHRRSILKKHVRLKIIDGVIEEPSRPISKGQEASPASTGQRPMFSKMFSNAKPAPVPAPAKVAVAAKVAAPAKKKPEPSSDKGAPTKSKTSAKATIMQLSSVISIRGALPACDNCEESNATIHCDDCDMDLCETNNCDRDMHKPTKMKNHVRHPLVKTAVQTQIKSREALVPKAAPITVEEERMCDNCDAQVAAVFCDQCDMNLCTLDNCDADMHKASKSKNHDRHRLKFVPKNVPSVESQAKAELAANRQEEQDSVAANRALEDSKQCELCNKNQAEVHCEQCQMYLCSEGKCDAELHATAGFKTHLRRTLAWVEEKRKSEAAKPQSIFRPSPAKAASVAVKPASVPAPAREGPVTGVVVSSVESEAGANGLPADLHTPCKCSLCEDAPATVYCVECKRYLCTKNNCDQEMHAMANFKWHTRVSKTKPVPEEPRAPQRTNDPRQLLSGSFTGALPERKRAQGATPTLVHISEVQPSPSPGGAAPGLQPMPAHPAYNPYQIAMGQQPVQGANVKMLTGWEQEVSVRVGDSFMVSRPSVTDGINANIVPQGGFDSRLLRYELRRQADTDVWTVTALALGSSPFVIRHANTRTGLQSDLVNLTVLVLPTSSSPVPPASQQQQQHGLLQQQTNQYKLSVGNFDQQSSQLPPAVVEQMNLTLPPSSPDVSLGGLSHLTTPQPEARIFNHNVSRQLNVNGMTGRVSDHTTPVRVLSSSLTGTSIPPTPPSQIAAHSGAFDPPLSHPSPILVPRALSIPGVQIGHVGSPAVASPSPGASPGGEMQHLLSRSISMQRITQSIVNAPDLAPTDKVAMVDNLVQRVLATPALKTKTAAKQVTFSTPRNQYFEHHAIEAGSANQEFKFTPSAGRLHERPSVSVWGVSDTSEEEGKSPIYVGGGESAPAGQAKVEKRTRKEQSRQHARRRNKIYWERQARAHKAREVAESKLKEEQHDRSSAKLSKFIPIVESGGKGGKGSKDRLSLSKEDVRMVAWLDAEDSLVKSHEDHYHQLRQRRQRQATAAQATTKLHTLGSNPVSNHGPPGEFDDGFLHLNTYDALFKLTQEAGGGEDSDDPSHKQAKKAAEEAELDTATDVILAQIRREAWTEASILTSGISPFTELRPHSQRKYPPLMNPPMHMHIRPGMVIDKVLDTSISANIKRASKERQITEMAVGLHSEPRGCPEALSTRLPVYRTSLQGLLPTPRSPPPSLSLTARRAAERGAPRESPASPLKRSISRHEAEIRRTYNMPLHLQPRRRAYSPAPGHSPARPQSAAVSRRDRMSARAARTSKPVDAQPTGHTLSPPLFPVSSFQ